MKDIRKWLQFSDNEISCFQFYFRDYLLEHVVSLSNVQAYQLAILGCETQFNMRIIKARINGESNVNIDTNNEYIRQIAMFDGLVDFVINKYVEDYNRMDIHKQYEYCLENKQSYFNISDKIKKSLMKDFDSLKITI